MNDSEFKADVVVKSSTQRTALNPHLNKNDLGIESDTGRIKVGVGQKWADTTYVGSAGVSDSIFFADANAITHSVTIVNGIITEWLSN